MNQYVTTFLNEMSESYYNDVIDEPDTLHSNYRIIHTFYRYCEMNFYDKKFPQLLESLSMHLKESVAAALALVLKMKASASNEFIIYQLNPPLPAVLGSNAIHYNFDTYMRRKSECWPFLVFRPLSTVDVVISCPGLLHDRFEFELTNQACEFNLNWSRLQPINLLNWKNFDLFLVYNKAAVPLHDIFVNHFGHDNFTIALTSQELSRESFIRFNPAELLVIAVVYYNGIYTARDYSAEDRATVTNLTSYYCPDCGELLEENDYHYEHF